MTFKVQPLPLKNIVTRLLLNLSLFELLKGETIAIDPNSMIITRHSDHV